MMSVRARNAEVVVALRHLSQTDPVMSGMIQRVGPFAMRLERNRFWSLVKSILSQQLSAKAARTIRGRVERLIDNQRTPQAVAELTLDQLKTAGVSTRKAEYLNELATQVLAGTLPLTTIGRRNNDDVIATLTEVRGIGRWTAEMFLIFSLGRLDVLPVGDLGIRAAIRSNYGMSRLPTEEECFEVGAAWQPFASVASWYCWRSLDLSTVKLPSK